MQHQPPDRNNPSNPLLKVAALTLDKDYLGEDSNSKTRVLLTLNFKRSQDMRGHTKTKYGDDVTVCFSLAIKRASLELNFIFEDLKSRHGAVRIERVAYLRALQSHDRTSDELAVKKTSSKKLSGRLKGALTASANKIGIGTNVAGEVSAGTASETASKRRTIRSIVKSNVAATYAGNCIHWEISPNMLPDEKTPSASWLQGELFKQANGASVDACVVSWIRNFEQVAPTMVASVFVTMADLVVDDLKVQTKTGDGIPIWQLDDSFSTLEVLSGAGAKERIVRQIIRKHLVSQGMTTEGARVQISRAHT